MKSLLYPFAFALTAISIFYSCSAEEEDTTPPPTVQQPTPEPETPATTQMPSYERYSSVNETTSSFLRQKYFYRYLNFQEYSNLGWFLDNNGEPVFCNESLYASEEVFGICNGAGI